MKKIALLACLLLLVSLPATAQIATTLPILGDAYAYESLTVTSGAAVGFTAATYNANGLSPKGAMITVETAAVRARCDGTSPTTSEGHSVAADAVRYVVGPNNIRKFRMIAVSSTATVRVTYFY